MRPSAKLAVVLAIAGTLGLSSGQTAQAQTNSAEKAEQLNNEGKALFSKQDFAGAAQKFREAILFSPEGRFYFNLCYCLNKMGQYREAITACDNVPKYQASNPLKEKAAKLAQALRDHVRNTNQDPDVAGDGGGGDGGGGDGGGDGGGGDGGGGDGGGGGNAGGGVGVAAPAPGGIIEEPAGPPMGAYKWGIGFELGPVGSSLGDPDLYQSSGVLVRGHADFILSEKRNFGVQAYLQGTTIGQEDGFDTSSILGVVDIGGAFYQHRKIKERLWWSWLGGVHIAIITPGDDGTGTQEGLATLGGRGEGSISYLLGSKGQHVLTAGLGLNLYLPTQDSTASFDPELVGLDKAGATFGVNFGYTLRFESPFGSTPVFTLE